MRRRSHHTRPLGHTRRRGSLYLVVLGTSMIVAVTALAAMSASRVEMRASVRGNDARDARLRARSSIEHAVSWLNANKDWRTELANSADQDEVTLGTGKFSWTVSDLDGDLTNDRRDHAVLLGVGKAGDATAVERVSIEPSGRAVTCLEAGVYSATEVYVTADARVTGVGLLAANETVYCNASEIDLDVEAGRIEGTGYLGATLEDAPPREPPGDHALDYYVMRGTRIDTDGMPTAGQRVVLMNPTLDRYVNDYGESNPMGIYVIDCQGSGLALVNANINGTLVVLNAEAGVLLRGKCRVNPAALNQPSLMVQGDASFGGETAVFEGRDDFALEGIVYVTQTATALSDVGLNGSLIAGAVEVTDSAELRLNQTPYALNYPPHGFTAGDGVRILPASWRRSGR